MGRNFKLYQHSVVDVCMRLHGCDTGSGDGIQPIEREDLVEWLRWRINNWVASQLDENGRRVDNAIRELAIVVLDQADESNALAVEEAAG